MKCNEMPESYSRTISIEYTYGRKNREGVGGFCSGGRLLEGDMLTCAVKVRVIFILGLGSTIRGRNKGMNRISGANLTNAAPQAKNC